MVFSPVSRLTSTSEQAAPKVVYLSGFELLAPVQEAQMGVSQQHTLLEQQGNLQTELVAALPTSNRLGPVSEQLFLFMEARNNLQMALPIPMQPQLASTMHTGHVQCFATHKFSRAACHSTKAC